MKRIFSMIGIISAIMLIIAGCSSEKTENNQENKEGNKQDAPLQVYTTIYPLTFFTEEIGKEFVEVESVLPAGVDAHTYEPTSKTMIDIAQADLFMYNGLGLEPFGDKLNESMKSEKVKVVEVGKTIDIDAHKQMHAHEEATHGDHEDHAAHEQENEEAHGHDDGHHHGDTDPHVWIDPTLAIQMAEVVKDQLIELQPEHKAEFENNFNSLKEQLSKLDEQFHEMADHAKNKEFLVSHAAFGYWEKNYGLKQISVAGLSPTDEPSQKQLKDMVETAKEHNIKYVIFEQNITPKVAKIVQSELRAEALQIHNLAVLTKEDEAKKENYVTLMEKNIETLKKATK
ncbi:zinc ABC transporter substrate-binding protein [Bacillus sp. REN10]|uniref:metal ABC transporter solute-binding protein, Zn/Mn family n=1 Tax=Bacillus sp. REN10 TaxID=2782541 RepID=UPI00193C83B9|nr:zinc ABC transporter substrate-binding protein [Bacillus sp. REN10]